MMGIMQVPFNKPVVLPEHAEILKESLTASQLSGNGVYTKKCEHFLKNQLKKTVQLVTSATHALEMSALLLQIKPGDEVILPSFTFVSTANPFVLRGAKLKFADNDEYGNILPSEIERLMTNKTKAVAIVHYAGASADLDAILNICKAKSILLIEDAAQAIGATYKGRPLGTIGELGCFSFHDTKNVTSGEGGALVFGDERFVLPAEIIREKGTNRSQFLQGMVDKYTWVGVGSSYILSDLNAAYLYPQLQKFNEISNKRKIIWDRYQTELGPSLEKAGIRALTTPSYNMPNYHLFAAVFQKGEQRNEFIAHMKSHAVACPFHYVSLHTSPFGASFYEGKSDHLPGCEKLSQCLVRFPMYYNMTESEQSYVIEKAKLQIHLSS